jgi:hypothetical protein
VVHQKAGNSLPGLGQTHGEQAPKLEERQKDESGKDEQIVDRAIFSFTIDWFSPLSIQQDEDVRHGIRYRASS